MFCIELAGISIGVDAPYPELCDYCREFLTDRTPDLTVSVSDEELALEAAATSHALPSWYYASVVVYRKIAERLPLYDACVYHGCAVTVCERAYLFSAKSGVGKTTHAKNWLLRFADEGCEILNGDKPILRLIDGEIRVYGTPWCGKESYGKRGDARLFGIAFLERAEENAVHSLAAENAALSFLSQMYLPKENSELAERALSLADTVLRTTPLISLYVNTAPESAMVAREAFERLVK